MVIAVAFALAALLPAPLAATADDDGDQKTDAPAEDRNADRQSRAETGTETDAAAETPTMPLDEVRVGMRGYGLTVFSGTKIEPFPVEVISIMRDFRPDTAVIWIVCDDPRLEESGPVSGMSGSPIYLWENDEEGELGEGGRLIGAFAYGYMGTTRCFAGVQPIEYMRGVAERAPEEVNDPRLVTESPNAGSAAGPAAGRAGLPGQLQRELELYLSLAREHDGPASAWRTEMLLNMLPEHTDGPGWRPQRDPPRGPAGIDGTVQRMQLPLAVPSRQAANLLEPILEPMGLMPVSSGGGGSGGGEAAEGGATKLGTLPRGVEADEVELAPGSVVSIPFAYGDLDFAASGTVTDVLPDGRVMALGHAMFGAGEVEMPMATGFVHYVVSRRTGSFKLSGSLELKGAMLRDENPAVVGRPGLELRTAPLEVTVNLPDGRSRSFNYQVVRNHLFMGQVAGILAIESILTEQGLPPEHTIRIRGQMHFDGGHSIEIDQLESDISPFGLLMALAPPVNTLANNPFQRVLLQRAELVVDVEAESRIAELLGATLRRQTVAPGETLEARIGIRPHRRPVEFHNLELDIPRDMPEGEYVLSISDARRYADRYFSLMPHEVLVRSADDLAEGLQRISAIRNDRLYLLVPTGPGGVAVNRDALPDLPSSRAALLAEPYPDRQVRAFARVIQKEHPLDFVITGSRELRFKVDRDAAR